MYVNSSDLLHLKMEITTKITMEITTKSNEFYENKTFDVDEDRTSAPNSNLTSDISRDKTILIIQSTVASVGVVANLTVIVVFLNHKKLRKRFQIFS